MVKNNIVVVLLWVDNITTKMERNFTFLKNIFSIKLKQGITYSNNNCFIFSSDVNNFLAIGRYDLVENHSKNAEGSNNNKHFLENYYLVLKWLLVIQIRIPAQFMRCEWTNKQLISSCISKRQRDSRDAFTATWRQRNFTVRFGITQ